MLRPTEARAEEARKKARDLFVRDRAKDAEVVKEREKRQTVQNEKTAKLKALRLAKEAAELAAAPAPKPVKKKAAKPAT
jgi:hypothetical protein